MPFSFVSPHYNGDINEVLPESGSGVSVPIPILVILGTKGTRENPPRGKLQIIQRMTACQQKNKQSRKSRSCLSSPVRIPSDADSSHVSQFAQPVPFACGIISSQAGRGLTGLSAPVSPTLGDRCPACARGGPCPGERSPDDAGVFCCATTFPLLYWPRWKEMWRSSKNVISVLKTQVKAYILMSKAIMCIYTSPTTKSLILGELKQGPTHDMTTHPSGVKSSDSALSSMGPS